MCDYWRVRSCGYAATVQLEWIVSHSLDPSHFVSLLISHKARMKGLLYSAIGLTNLSIPKTHLLRPRILRNSYSGCP